MLNSKERARLLSLSAKLETQNTIGKEGFSESVAEDIGDSLRAHELVKVKVLETAPTGVRELGEEAADKLEAELVKVIGKKFILYRKNPKNQKIFFK
jgi:RNA-binding protein